MTKLLGALIMIFWATMTFLLVRMQVSPDSGNLLSVPPSHVIKLMFLHEQRSYLHISHEQRRDGHLSLSPRRVGEAQILDVAGSLALNPPSNPRDRLNWNGTLTLSQDLQVRHARITTNSRELEQRVEVEADFEKKQASYTITSHQDIVETQEINLEEDSLQALLTQFGIDPAPFGNFAEAKLALTARPASLKIHGEEVAGYKLSVLLGELVVAEAHISMLGQVLQARTFIGYSLFSEAFDKP